MIDSSGTEVSAPVTGSAFGIGESPVTEAGRRAGARARAGWLATTLALAAALVISSLLNFRAARGAVQTLNMGQAEIHAAGLRAMRMEEGPIEGTEALRSVLDSQREAGLRFIALVDAEGEVLLSVGEPVEGEGSGVIYQPEAPTGVPRLAVVADRVRAFVPAPPERAVLSPFQQGRTPSRVTVRFRPRYYVLEFEPVPASNVVAQATRSFFLSCIGAALLTLIAVGFWRVSRRYEAAQRQIESQKRLSQLGEMSAVLAHEIRNPLASLKGNAQLLAESLTEDARMKRRADRVVGEAIRLETLTADLLDFARSVPVTRTLVDPGELVRATAEEVAPGRVVVELSGAPELWPLDRDKLHQALANLIRNACQIMDDGPTPIVAVLVENGQLVFTVRDFGPGVEAVNRERIFEPFFTTRTQGTGLGLPVAKRIAELHGGSIRAESHPEGGAVFRITLPDAQR